MLFKDKSFLKSLIFTFQFVAQFYTINAYLLLYIFELDLYNKKKITFYLVLLLFANRSSFYLISSSSSLLFYANKPRHKCTHTHKIMYESGPGDESLHFHFVSIFFSITQPVSYVELLTFFSSFFLINQQQL